MRLATNYLGKLQIGKLPIVMLIFLMTSLGYAQENTVTGTVLDNDGNPLPGVNVVVKGTSTGTQTDFDGNFTLNNVAQNAILEFSYIGFKSVEATFIGASLNIAMEEDTQALDEVVVIGYGTQKKSDVTGAVATVDSESIDKFIFSDASQALQGQLAGVSVQSSGGAPGAAANIVIRGIGTFSNNGPLFVIDGVITGDLSSVNPADIESVSVLKDASALAIYGSRAANGVVIVNTKKGTRGKMSIELNTSFAFSNVVNEPDWASNRQYADIVNRANDNDGTERFPANDTQFDPNFGNDLYGESIQTGAIYNTNLRLSGGGENTLFSLSLNHYDEEGIVKFSDFERYTVRANGSFTQGRFKLESTIGLTRTVNEPNVYFNRERNIVPTINLRDSEGNFSFNDLEERGVVGTTVGAFYGISNQVNELALASLEERTITRNTVLGSIIASYEIIDGLTYKLNMGIESFSNNNFNFQPDLPVFTANTMNATSQLSETNTTFLSTLVENTLNFNKTYGKHTIDLLGGYTEQINDTRTLGATAIDLIADDIRVASAGEIQSVPSVQTTVALQSFLGRFNYTFDDRYVLTASIRRDGSSLFEEDLRWGTFPSGAFAWNISNEPFMKNFDALTNLKFRVGYGEIGSNNIDAYSTNAVLNLFSEYIVGEAQNRTQGFSITNSVNPNVTWETTKSTNVGLEFNALENRLSVTMDYFKKDTEDILVSTPLSFITGTGNAVPDNSGSIENSGFEFLASYRDQLSDDFSFTASVNFSTLNNEVTSIGGGSPDFFGSFTSNTINSTVLDVGAPIGSFFGYINDGIYQTDEEATAANDQTATPQAGDLRFRDIAGPDGSGPDGVIDANDRTFIGNPAPTFEYGINLTGQYKNWDIALFFNGVSGNKILNGIKYRGFFDTDGNYLAEALNGWTPSNTNTSIPRNTRADPGLNRRMSTFYLEDGAYFRLRNAQVGYSFTDDILDKLKLARLRLYASAINLFTITDYTGYYPEVGRNGRGGQSIFTRGVDEGSFPTGRTFQLGLQVSF